MVFKRDYIALVMEGTLGNDIEIFSNVQSNK